MKRVFTIPERTHGPGPIFFTWQRGASTYFVTTGYDNTLNIYDRHGEKVEHINLPGYCTGLAWDSDGEILGIITDRSPVIILWDANSRKTIRVDTGVRDTLSVILWAKKAQLLAVGTSKGNVLIYNHQTSRKIPILGKHTKRVISGAWSEQNLLALVGEEKVLTLSNEEGDTICELGLKGEPSLVQFSTIKTEETRFNQSENCVSLVLNKRNLMLFNVNDAENPHTLSFQDKHGIILGYHWLSDGFILVGFSTGLFIVLSTNSRELGSEVNQYRVNKDSLSNFAVCKGSKKLAACTENVIKVYDTNDLDDVKSILTVDDEKSIDWMEWSDDGQLLACGSPVGSLHVYLTKLTIIGSSFGTRLAYLSSLLEVTVVSVSEDLNDAVIIIRVDIEPSLLAIGPFHLAVAMNNRVWFYALTGNEQLLLREREYLGIVKQILLNGDYAAVLFTDGKVQLHLIENESAKIEDLDSRETRMFHDGPAAETGMITTMVLTNEFFIYASNSGSLEFFLLEDWAMVNVYRHTTGIKMMSADINGLRIVLVDERNDVFMYNAVTDFALQITAPPDLPTNIKNILWESYPLEKSVFVLADSKSLYVYAYNRDTIEGLTVEFVGKDKLPSGQYPLLFYNGVMICQTQSGKTSNFVLSTHDFTEKMHDRQKLKDVLLRDILKLRRYQDAWKICEYLNDLEAWTRFGESAMHEMDIDLAIKIFRITNNTGMVLSLESLKTIEERNLIAGHLAMFLEKYDLAQQSFLVSSAPKEALEMRQNLQDWDSALVLAKRLSPNSIPIISREYATQLEFSGNYQEALEHFEKALIEEVNGKSGGRSVDGESLDSRLRLHNELCYSGIARNSIRCGNVRRGIDYALKLEENHSLHLECAQILEQLKLYSDAALMYEKGKNIEKAIKLYFQVKNSKKVEELIHKVDEESNRDLLSQYAKLKEAEGRFREAVKAYQKAKDYLSAVRLLLDKLNNPGEAVKIVKETKSVDGAKMIARFFQRMNDMSSAIEFLVLSKCNEEAFGLASSTGQMEIYANVLLETAKEIKADQPEPISDYQSVAIFYEQDKNPLMAGRFHCLAGNYKKGIKLLLQSASINTNEGDAIRLAIDFGSKSKDDQVIRQIIDFLIGELDGVPKDFKYLFRLYMSLKQYREAAKTAIIIAREEQNAGNYRNSHNLLFGMCQELRKQKIPVPQEMSNSLMLIHSYLLAKMWIKFGDNLKSAHLLIRVANNISKFPAHTVPILTSTVIQCQKAGLKNSALQFAVILIKPEYREQIDLKFKRKIETLVRKSASTKRTSGNDIEASEQSLGLPTPCPYCDRDIPEMELNCNNCRNTIPFCISSGCHMIKGDSTACPNCNFPAILSSLVKFLEKDSNCPMCGQTVESNHELVNVDPLQFSL